MAALELEPTENSVVWEGVCPELIRLGVPVVMRFLGKAPLQDVVRSLMKESPAWLQSDDAIPLLTEMLLSERATAAIAVLFLQDGGRLAKTILALPSDPAAAATSLVSYVGLYHAYEPEASVQRAVLELALSHPDPETRAAAVERSIFRVPEQRVYELLERDPSPRVRERAVKALRYTKPGQQKTSAILAACGDPDARVRGAALERLQPYDTGAPSILLAACNDPDPAVRTAGVEGLGELGLYPVDAGPTREIRFRDNVDVVQVRNALTKIAADANDPDWFRAMWALAKVDPVALSSISNDWTPSGWRLWGATGDCHGRIEMPLNKEREKGWCPPTVVVTGRLRCGACSRETSFTVLCAAHGVGLPNFACEHCGAVIRMVVGSPGRFGEQYTFTAHGIAPYSSIKFVEVTNQNDKR